MECIFLNFLVTYLLLTTNTALYLKPEQIKLRLPEKGVRTYVHK